MKCPQSLLIIGWLFSVLPDISVAEVLGHISDETDSAPVAQAAKASDRKIIYRVICNAEDPLPDCGQAPLVDSTDDNQPAVKDAEDQAHQAEVTSEDKHSSKTDGAEENLVQSQASKSKNKKSKQSDKKQKASHKSAAKVTKSNRSGKSPVKAKKRK